MRRRGRVWALVSVVVLAIAAAWLAASPSPSPSGSAEGSLGAVCRRVAVAGLWATVSTGTDDAHVVVEEAEGAGLDGFPFPVMTDPPHRPHDPVGDFGSVTRGSDGSWEFRPPAATTETGLYGRFWLVATPPAPGAELLGVRFVDASWSGETANTLVVVSLLDRRLEDNAAGAVTGAVQGLEGQLVGVLCEPDPSTVELALDRPDGDAAGQLLTVIDAEDVPLGAPVTRYPEVIRVGAIEWLWTDVVAPVVRIDSPPDDARLALGSLVLAGFVCDDGTGSGVVGCEGSVATGDELDTSTTGRHRLEVRAVDRAGNAAVVARDYLVEEARPDVRVRRGITGSLLDDDQYRTQAIEPVLRLRVVPGGPARLRFSVQNDAGFVDRLSGRSRSSCPDLRVRHVDAGVDVTGLLADGSWVTGDLAPSTVRRITTTVSVPAGTPRATCSLTFSARSTTHPWRVDRVRVAVAVR